VNLYAIFRFFQSQAELGSEKNVAIIQVFPLIMAELFFWVLKKQPHPD
jgi:hypothetical protein